MIEAILSIFLTITKIALCTPLLYKFLVGDKEKRETLWYGMAVLLFTIADK